MPPIRDVAGYTAPGYLTRETIMIVLLGEFS
jgi:hypothetical protein